MRQATLVCSSRRGTMDRGLRSKQRFQQSVLLLGTVLVY